MSPGTVGLTLACLVVVAETARVLRNVMRLRRLDSVPVQEPARWPSVSVVIAARDEAADVGHAVRSRLAEDYPTLDWCWWTIDRRNGAAGVRGGGRRRAAHGLPLHAD